MEAQRRMPSTEAPQKLTSEMAVRSPSIPPAAEVRLGELVEETAPLRPYPLVVMGRAGVGKTALTIRFVRDHFVEDYDPTIEDIHEKQFAIPSAKGGLKLGLEIRDTAGQENYSALRSSWMQQAFGFLFVFSLIDRQTFDELRLFQEELMDCFDDDPPPSVLVANKSDLDRSRWVVTEAEVLKLKDSWKSCNEIVYTSAKDGQNVTDAFERLTTVVHERVIYQRMLQAQKEQRAIAAQQASDRQLMRPNVCRMLQCKDGCFTQ